MNLLLRGVQAIDPTRGSDIAPCDVLLRDGVVAAIGPGIAAEPAVVVDLQRRAGEDRCVVAPAFIDLHAHLREPGDEEAETVKSGARAAAAGGFAIVLAMANTRPPVDTPERVAAAVERNRGGAVTVLQTAAVTHNLDGADLTDIGACAQSGAAEPVRGHSAG